MDAEEWEKLTAECRLKARSRIEKMGFWIISEIDGEILIRRITEEDKKFSAWRDSRARQFQDEIRQEVEQHHRDMRDFIRFQNRSAGQIRRFQIAAERRQP